MKVSDGMLKGKVVVVTGGAGLLGRTFIAAIVQNGGIGVIADIDQDAGLKALDRLKRDLQSDQLSLCTARHHFERIDQRYDRAWSRATERSTR